MARIVDEVELRERIAHAIDAAIAYDFELMLDWLESASSVFEESVLQEEVFRRAVSGEATRRWPEAEAEDVEGWADLVDPDDRESSLYNLAIALWNVGEHEASVRAFRQSLDSGCEEARIYLAESLVYLDRPLEARPELRQIIAAGGAAGERAAGLLGEDLFATDGRTDEEVLNLLARGSSVGREVAVAYARVLREHGRLDEAVHLLRDESAEGNDLAAIVLGNMLWDDLDDATGAEAAYLRGIELGDAFSAYNLSLLLEGQGRAEESQKWLAYAAGHGDELAKARLNP